MGSEELPSLLSGRSSSGNFKSKTFVASIDAFPSVIEFFESTLEEFEASMKVITQMNIIAEELFTNVAKFSYPGKQGYCQIDIEKKENYLEVKFIDNGIPFNPLAKEDPDITLEASERDIGGLGILMVKKMSDKVSYEYISNCNILTLKKNL